MLLVRAESSQHSDSKSFRVGKQGNFIKQAYFSPLLGWNQFGTKNCSIPLNQGVIAVFMG